MEAVRGVVSKSIRMKIPIYLILEGKKKETAYDECGQ
jgi:hypothetical protein